MLSYLKRRVIPVKINDDGVREQINSRLDKRSRI